jgi:titin
LAAEPLFFEGPHYTLLDVQRGLRRIIRLFSVVSIVGAGSLVAPAFFGTPASATTATTVTQTFGFDSDALQNFTVPSDVTSLTITATGGQGGWGGADSSGNPPAGGYQGQVSGTISVTPGDYLTIGVGAGADEPIDTGCTAGRDEQSPTDPYDAAAGVNPLGQYDGGMGGAPGYNGCSGYGGAGGAATAVEVGSSPSAPTTVGTIVAGGGGGDGGSGQYVLVRGQIGLASYVPQTTPTPITYGIPAGCTTACTSHNTIESPTALPANPTQGQPGIAVFTMCGGDTTGSNADQFFTTSAPNSEAGCDGGGGAGGGGGAAGGSAGNDEFGSGSSDEWYGQGGSPGENSTGGLVGLSADYAYYADTDTGVPSGTDTFADPGAQFDGSVTITYSTGVPAAPTAVAGTPGNGSLALQWAAPSSPGAAPISDYIVQYSSDGGAQWVTDDTGSTATSATISGLTNGTGYIVEVEAVNSIGDGPYSAATGTLTPTGPPGAPTITSLSAQDGALQVHFLAPSTGAPFTGYLYQLDGSGPWLATTSTSNPLTISGLTDGTAYSVEIEAVNASGTGAPSNSESQTPVAVPGAPTITSVQVGAGSASVAFTPGGNGGSTITGYQYSTNGGTNWTPTSTASPLSLTGLANGATITLELEAVNGSGAGAPTTTSFTTPSAPAAPVISSITSQNEALSVSFTAPASNGSPISDYEWSTDGGTSWFSESAFGTPCQSGAGSAETCEVAALSTNGTTLLTNGTTYPVELRAVNGVGTGAASGPQSGTPYTTPGAPAITTGAGGMIPANQTLIVSFTAPVDNGGSAVTGYQYSTDAGASWLNRTDGQSATATTMTISALSADGTTPLDNGTTYSVEIRAENAAGSGPGSAVATGIPVNVPDAPVITAVTPENGALAVAFTPGSNGGAAITSYQYSLDGGSTWTTTGSLSPDFTIGGLTNGTSYPVTIEAVNQEGDSAPSTAAPGTPATVPGQPTITTTIRGNQSITVAFAAPSSGGSAILSYQYSTDGGATWSTATATASPLVITALSTDGVTAIANGTDYPVETRAVNAIGDSQASSSVNVSPAAVPGAPTVTLTPGDGVIAVGVTVTNNGGSPVTGIDYSLNGGPFVSTGTTGSSFTITGLTNGTSDSISVRDDNAIGSGTASAPASATPITVPGAPVAVLAAEDAASADITWTAPAADGGSPITGYTATAYTSSAGTTTAGTACTTTALACTVTGLTNGTTYYIGVVATNAAGSSPVSDPLQSVTPLARPGAPTLTGITSGDSFLSVSFTAGTPGGDPISSYQYSLNGGTTWVTAAGTSSPLLIDGLVDGTSYTVSVRAVSAAGPGATSTNTETATPATYPNPVNAATVTANGENGQIAVSWTVPADGGSPITQAQATAFSLPSGGTQEGTCTTTTNLAVGDTTSCTITGLVNGTTYYVSTQSDNAVNWSGRSSPFVAATPSIDPGVVSNVTGTPGDGQVSLSWTPGSTGESAITNYVISYSSGGSYVTFTHSASTATSATVTGLANGTPYTFKIAAVNSQGTGATSAPSSPVTPTGPSITSSPLSGAEVNVPYSATPTISGGTGPYTWSVINGSLPTGLTVNSSTGAITGTPSAIGPYAFTLLVTDALTGTSSQAESVSVVAGPSISSTAFGDGEVGVAYSATPSVSGTTGPYAWSVTNGILPIGLTINPVTGTVTGTPGAIGTYSFTLVATDALGGTSSQTESVGVVAGPSITSTAFGDGEVGVAYSATPSVSGTTGPYTWSVTNGSLPTGLTINASTGTVSGQPTASGPFSFTLVATDALGGTSSQAESVDIAGAPIVGVSAVQGGEVDVPYNATPTVSGGTGPYTWSVSIGSLPTGLTINPTTGDITGTPSASGPATFTLTATDIEGQSASQGVTVLIAADPSIATASLPDGQVGAAYSQSVAGAGGTGPYTWSVSIGSLPTGLTINPTTGAITGTPGASGPATFTVTLTDADGQTASEGYAIAVAPAPAPPVAPPSITTNALPDAQVGAAYDQTIAGSGGTTPYRWSVSAGSLPAGLSLDPAVGALTGTPSATGQDSFTVTVTDANGLTASKGFSLEVDAAPAAPVAPPSITTTSLPDGLDGSPYAVTPDVSGGTGPYTFWLSSGTLPSGLSLNPATGTINGTVTSGATTETFTVAMTDGDGHTTTQVYTLTVATPSANSRSIAATPDGKGYWVVGENGTVMAFGDAVLYGSAVHMDLNGPIVGIDATPDGKGYWLVASDGGVFAFGDAGFYGSAAQLRLNQPVLGMVSTPDGKGYWLLAYDGGVFAYGDASFYGSAAPLRLNQPIVGISATPDGKGYWLVASDGGVFSFGDAAFYGSAAPLRLNEPIMGFAATPDGKGYWLVASDGGVFAFGGAGFYGSATNLKLNEPLTGIQATPDGKGYWLSAADGGVFSYGDAGFYGAATGQLTQVLP